MGIRTWRRGLTLESIAAVDRNLRAKHEYHVVPNAGHFAFVLCPPAFAKAAPEFCKDAPGFDRAPFHNRSMRICSRSSVRI